MAFDLSISSLPTGYTIIGLGSALFIGYQLYEIIYNIFFHPLARFPGPFLNSFSNIPYSATFLGGKQPFKVLELHRKYGSVVRTAPNELSFNSAQSWKDIYGFRAGHGAFVKSPFYDGGSFASRGVHSIVSERDPEEHGKMRRYLSHAFSDRALSEQETLVSQTIDRFMVRIGEKGADKGGINLSSGFESMTGDIISDLAFGESFNSVEKDEPHPWIAIILGALTQGALVDVLKRFPALGKVIMVVMRSHIKKLTEDTGANEDYSIELVARRVQRGTDRHDFMSRILEQRDPSKVSDLQLAAHASDFVLAGSETTATCLSTIVFFLLKNPKVLGQLSAEIRSNFASYHEISGKSTLGLSYLRAVILEGLRIYPPVPIALPRVVPEGGDTVDGHFLAAGSIVATNPTAACLDPANFAEPFSFKPERWQGEAHGDVLDAMQAFSLGPRGCIGQHLGWMELRTALSKLLWLYDLDLVQPDLDWHRDSEMHTLWRKPKLFVRAQNRGVAMS